jgi:hypothetical protein
MDMVLVRVLGAAHWSRILRIDYSNDLLQQQTTRSYLTQTRSSMMVLLLEILTLGIIWWGISTISNWWGTDVHQE